MNGEGSSLGPYKQGDEGSEASSVVKEGTPKSTGRWRDPVRRMKGYKGDAGEEGRYRSPPAEYRRRRTDLEAPSQMEIRDIVERLVKVNRWGVTTSDVAAVAGCSRQWALTCLKQLEEEGRVLHEVRGRTWIWRTTQRERFVERVGQVRL